MASDTLTWIGIGLLVLQSGTFSGLNLAMFGVTALRLQTLADMGDQRAVRLLAMRKDSNFLLTTILWGNVGTNVLLALLSDSVMTGVVAFVFSTFVITLGGEIIPQAYFSRHALKMGSLIAPVLRLYQFLLFPIAKPSALMLDAWLGRESIDYLPEEELRTALKLHAKASGTDVSRVEGTGAVNFMELDDVQLTEEGNPVDPESLLILPMQNGRPLFPAFACDKDDPFVAAVRHSEKRWVLIAAEGASPTWALDASEFLRATLIRGESVDPMTCCHRPITVSHGDTPLSEVLGRFETLPGEDLLVKDVILLWGQEKRIITGSDILGFLMRGIAKPAPGGAVPNPT
jgi:hypothetical protein